MKTLSRIKIMLSPLAYILGITSITLLNSCDEYIAPNCSILSPEEKAVYFHGDTMRIVVVNDEGNRPVEKVKIYMNDLLVDSLLVLRSKIELIASEFDPGYYTLKAQIIDSENNQSSDEINLTIEGKYLSGKYHAEYITYSSNRWKPFLSFQLTFDVISNIDFDAYNAEGVLRTEDSAININMWVLKGLSPAMYTPMIEDNIENATIVPEFIDIDVVSGATYSSNEAKELLKVALQSASERDTSYVYISF